MDFLNHKKRSDIICMKWMYLKIIICFLSFIVPRGSLDIKKLCRQDMRVEVKLSWESNGGINRDGINMRINRKGEVERKGRYGGMCCIYNTYSYEIALMQHSTMNK